MFKIKHTKVGNAGEMYVKNWLESKGYDVSYTTRDFAGDLDVFDWSISKQMSVEVKTARANIHGKYNFCMYRKGHTDATHSDVIALVFMGKKKTMIIKFISATSVVGMKNLVIASHPDKYQGKWSQVWKSNINLD